MATPTRSGIPTTYREANFRSRLEARWAVFFDLVGWRWTYEPLDTGNWIPDFLIHGDAPFLVEVGPCATPDEFDQKGAKAESYGKRPTLLLGLSPHVLSRHDDPYAGRLINEMGDNGQAPVLWIWCDDCDSLAIFGDDRNLPCGHFSHHPYYESLEHLWSRAGSAVQWQP